MHHFLVTQLDKDLIQLKALMKIYLNGLMAQPPNMSKTTFFVALLRKQA